MNFDDKKRSIKKSLDSIRERVNLNKDNGKEEERLNDYVQNFINSL